jgi:outer membrane receptor protein involved in Fe transport
VVDAHVEESAIGLFAQEDVRWTPWLRTLVGSRLDFFGFQVVDNLESLGTTGDRTSGVRERGQLSPKGSIVVTPIKELQLFGNVGYGFHSNDARAVVRQMDPGTPLARALGYELGARARIADRVDVAGSLWGLDLKSETVWVGDDGVTEARGRTRRLGAELELRAAILPWLRAELDTTYTRGRFRDLPEGEDRIPLAPTFTLTGGVAVEHPSGGFGRLGVRSLSDRPATEDDFLTAEGFTLFDVMAGYRTDRYEVFLAVDNLFNAEWREAQFATTSRLATDPPSTMPPPAGVCPAGTRVGTDDAGNFAGCEDVHFTPGAPLNAMLTARIFF